MTFSSMVSRSKGYEVQPTDWDKIVDNFAAIGGAGAGGVATLGGTGWAIGNGTAEYSYRLLNKWMHGRFHFTFGSTSTAGSGGLEFTLPGSVTPINEPQAVAVAVYDDSGSAVKQGAGLVLASGSVVTTDLVSGTPITFATDDLIVVQFEIELA